MDSVCVWADCWSARALSGWLCQHRVKYWSTFEMWHFHPGQPRDPNPTQHHFHSGQPRNPNPTQHYFHPGQPRDPNPTQHYFHPGQPRDPNPTHVHRDSGSSGGRI
ncbi:hypothetical protein I79_002481 [Cricetulus griseus]|uniref:Uncharacterized protein n=1 Tax=Cricetulus griseus TaxID=10029 RepID=G3GXI9_CRIGR|nr:hypothetical protein I79_002481 [Cricetulus griseus]